MKITVDALLHQRLQDAINRQTFVVEHLEAIGVPANSDVHVVLDTLCELEAEVSFQKTSGSKVVMPQKPTVRYVKEGCDKSTSFSQIPDDTPTAEKR